MQRADFADEDTCPRCHHNLNDHPLTAKGTCRPEVITWELDADGWYRQIKTLGKCSCDLTYNEARYNRKMHLKLHKALLEDESAT